MHEMKNFITIQIKNDLSGGSNQKYFDLIKGLLQKGHSIHHISPKGFDFIKQENFFHYTVYDTPILPYIFFFFPQALIQLVRIGSKKNIDAVITYSILEGIFGIIFKLFHLKAKFILSVHGDERSSIELRGKNKILDFLFVKLYSCIEKIVIWRADHIFYISEYTRQTILKRTGNGNLQKNEVIINDVSNRVVNLSKAPAIKFDDKKIIIGYVGLLYAEGKGLINLIKAFFLINQAIPDSLLVLVGDGPDKNRLIQLTELLNLQQNIRFIGLVPNPLVYIKGFDLLVLPSIHEGSGNVLIESIYVGTPAIGSNVGGIPEVLFYKKLLFEPNNPEILGNKIIKIFKNDNAYKEITSLCTKRKESLEYYRNEKVITKILKLLD